MSESLTSSPTFPAATCDSCGKTVLTHLSFDEAGQPRRCCVNCDGPITSALAWLSTSELETQGYQVGPARVRPSGGCGSGQCGRSAQRH
ncbi:MAG TPA: hypothetical protein VKS22_03955 [Candidatus Binataceae bacterium]|nr:hypothetical protein [Candidatus Binataceae bacterium]